MADLGGQNRQPLLRAMGSARLFGVDGTEIIISGRRTRGLLTYLALAPEQSATRERLCGLFWGDRGDEQARSSLRQCLFELNATLKAAHIDILDASRDRVALRANALESDVSLFEQAIANHDVPTTVAMIDAMGSANLLDDLELGGLFREWQDQARGRVSALMADKVIGLLDHLEGQHDWPQVKHLADAWLRRDPLEENVVASAIRADVATGARAAAQRRFNGFAALLTNELGVEPSDAVRAALEHGQPISISAVAPVLDTPIRDAPTPPVNREPVLAVLAFDNLSNDAELDFFSEGISEEILQILSRTDALKVVARASSFQFRGRDKDTSKVSAALGATHLLDGTVRRGGTRVRITASLINCTDLSTIWSGRFDGDLSDVFALQDEIATAVAQGLNLIFAPARSAQKIDPTAHDCYLRARSLSGSPPDVEESLMLLGTAVRLAPDFAAAWGSLAMAHAVRARWIARPDEFAGERDSASLAATRALALDPSAGLPLVALSLLEPEGLFAAREALLNRAMALAPCDPELLKQAADFAASVGRVEEGYHLMCQAADIDPLNLLILSARAQILIDLGKHEEGYQEFSRLRNRWPDFDWFTAVPMITAAHTGDWDIADALLALPRGTSREYKMSRNAVELFKLPLAERQAHIRGSISHRLDTIGNIEIRTLIFMYINEMQDEAFAAWAQSSHDYRHMRGAEGMFLLGILFGITTVGLRNDVRFINLCARLGLCDYWVASGRWPDCVSRTEFSYDFKAEARKHCEVPA